MFLKEQDKIALIATSSYVENNLLNNIKRWLDNLEINYEIIQDLSKKDLFFAGTNQDRFEAIKAALLDQEYKAIWCLRGGYGAGLLIPQLMNVKQPKNPKLLIGYSDITSLHIMLNQHWRWPSIHADVIMKSMENNAENSELLLDFLYGKSENLHLSLEPLNALAKDNNIITTTCCGGNLALMQCSLATIWQFNASNKIVFIEDVDEPAYRIDRMLNHLIQAKIFDDAVAIILGEFTSGKNTYTVKEDLDEVLFRFIDKQNIPVLKSRQFGHIKDNKPVAFGFISKLSLGDEPFLEISNIPGL